MDDVPYEFVDRVFTKLDEDNISKLSKLKLNAPIWREIARVYRQKLRMTSADVCCMAMRNGRLAHKLIWGDYHLLTTDELLQKDTRFNRVYVLICRCKSSAKNMKAAAIDEFRALIKHVSLFDLDLVTMWFSNKPPPAIYQILMDNDLRTENFGLHWFDGAEEILKKQVQSPHLTTLTVGPGDWTPLLGLDLETFVCQPHFARLWCKHECFGVENFKRIFAYWKDAKPTNGWTITMNTSQNMSEEFKRWLTSDDDSSFSERIGDFNLTVQCTSDKCFLECKKVD